MQSRLRICALRSARRSPEKATSQLMHKTNPPGLAPLLLRLAPIFGTPKHCDVGCEALSESAGGEPSVPQVAESSAGDPPFIVDGFHRGMPAAAQSSIEAAVAV